jgi:hypothetical protein
MESEFRYQSLIQPIQDLAQNWDINIADSLTDYLEELDDIRIKFGSKTKSLNFAQAAMVIQGSTAIYSRKVEYLHRLVFQTLEHFANKSASADNQVCSHFQMRAFIFLWLSFKVYVWLFGCRRAGAGTARRLRRSSRT